MSSLPGEPPGPPEPLGPLGIDRNSRLLLAAVLFTNIGMGGHTLATGVLLYAATRSAMAFAGTLGVGFALGLIGQFFAGGLLDRSSPRRVDVFVNGSRGVLILLAAVVVAETHGTLLVALTFIYMSILGPVYRANSFAITRRVAGDARLPRVNALRSGLVQVGQLLGLGLVSLLITFVPPAAAFAANGVWFLLGGGCVLMIDGLPRRAAGGALAYAHPAAVWREWVGVIRASRHVPSVYVHCLISSSSPVAAALINLYIAPLNQALGGTSLGLALLDGGFALGAILASARLSRLRTLSQAADREVSLALFVTALGLLGLGTIDHLGVAALCTLTIGAATTVTFVRLNTSLQLRSAQGVMGRVAVIQDAVGSVIALALVPVIGKVADLRGVRSAVLAGALAVAGYLAVALVSRTRWAFGQDLYTRPIDAFSATPER